MAPCTISLISSRTTSTQRAHFAIFVPSASDSDTGTLIHVFGAPMVGYKLEFKRNYPIAMIREPYTRHQIGQIDTQYIADTSDSVQRDDSIPRGIIELVASQVPPPRISQNFMAPVNETTNKRCQEWTMEYVRRLVQLGYIDASAVQVVQSLRDPPTHGIGLQPVGRGLGSSGGAAQ
ncbi:hypothetical protein PHISCL_05279 [Aspergillus sclerotialis]|uniref:Uncharacterized protein n=1 Tax=Aspergillus sclerotialis TaxID=2070753 RepID=A0A3A2ZH83_9EURO|nr:hypothetical protein PHISCL_05279 [Aspergillus sclerotialis]